MKKGKAEAYMEFCFFLILLSVYMHGIGKLFGPIRFPDEFGYWSHGARLLGYDWNEVSGIHIILLDTECLWRRCLNGVPIPLFCTE